VIAAKFLPVFDSAARELSGALLASRAVDADIAIPSPEGLAYLGYQRAGVAYMLAHTNTLLADEMGLGKTIQVCGLINACPDVLRVLIVCPASLRLNWKRELEKWLTVPMSIRIIDSKTAVIPNAAIHIVNYDILHRFPWQGYDLLVLDEAHYCKNETARRTKKALAIRAPRKVFLTGTPILSRPIEIYSLVKTLSPALWPSRSGFGMRYCNGFLGTWGYDFTGASNLEELNTKLCGSIMVRRLKVDVMSELPQKSRQIIELPANGKTLRREKKFRDTYDAAVRDLARPHEIAFENLSLVRHETALEKVPQVIEFVIDALESSEKVVIFAHHRDVIEKLEQGLAAFWPRVITGDTPLATRQCHVDEFQVNPSIRVLIGNMQAAGVGITLTAASHVIFAELDWVPGVVTQAEDRLHRIGQKDAVLVQHLVLEGTIDAAIARTLVAKQNVLDAALDGKEIVVDKVTAADIFLPTLTNQPTERNA
jgi:SWI/SNF-related matrix-associated actin-dependent regulator 1 of chromatin subfamily A